MLNIIVCVFIHIVCLLYSFFTPISSHLFERNCRIQVWPLVFTLRTESWKLFLIFIHGIECIIMIIIIFLFFFIHMSNSRFLWPQQQYMPTEQYESSRIKIGTKYIYAFSNNNVHHIVQNVMKIVTELFLMNCYITYNEFEKQLCNHTLMALLTSVHALLTPMWWITDYQHKLTQLRSSDWSIIALSKF